MRHEPIVITKHGRESLVVMSAGECERLKRRDRRVGVTAELPEATRRYQRHLGLIIRHSYLW